MFSRRHLLASLLCASLPVTALADDDNDWDAVKPRPAPPLTLVDLDGKTHDLKQYAGRTVIVNFWATWCPACVEELPTLARLSEYAEAARVVVLTVNGENDMRQVARFLKRKRLALTVLNDVEDKATRDWEIAALPSSFIVDPRGRVRYECVGGADFQSAELRKILRVLNENK